MLINKNSVQILTTGEKDIILPKGTIIQVTSTICAAGSTAIIGASGTFATIFHSVCLVNNQWHDRMILNHDVRGINVVWVDGLGGTTYLYLFRPSGASR